MSRYKCVILNNIRDYELCPLVSINIVDKIEWKFNQLTPSVYQLK